MKPEEKIYNAYFQTQKSSLYFNQIKELSKLSDSSLANTLKRLVENKIFTKEKSKSNTNYTIKNKKIIALKFSEIAIQKYSNLNPNIKIPLKYFLKDLTDQIHTIILFGSASKKTEHSKSDIDLLVIGNITNEILKNKKEAEITSKHPISLFKATREQCKQSIDPVIIQARKTGFPIYREQNYYEDILDEY
ncbi:MAG: putative nucleotidyltransferase [Patescibacteria group bacterium]|jgi:predicted nucleotidyltransferase